MAEHLLWISPRWPLPAVDGARQATVALVRGLAAAGAQIDVIAYADAAEAGPPGEAARALGVASVTTVARGSSGWAHRLARLATRPLVPITVAPFVRAGVADAVRVALARDPDLRVVHDGLHAAGWLLAGPPPRIRSLVLRPHNVEQALWRQAAAQRGNPLARAAFLAQGALIGRFERRIARLSSHILPVSDADAAHFRAIAPAAQVATTPIGMDLAQAPPLPAPRMAEPALLFVGKLDWEPNRQGLAWFLDEVWPEAVRRRPGLTLAIVGSGEGDWLGARAALPGVSRVGRVDSVLPWYESAMAAIVPVFLGSGTRVKVIEASLLGRPSIGTALGVDGVGLRAGHSYLRAETAAEWIEALVALTADEAARVGAAARETVSARFDPRRIADDVLRLLAGDPAPADSRKP